MSSSLVMNDKLEVKLLPQENTSQNDGDKRPPIMFTIHNMDVSFVNMLRCSLYDEIPTVAIEKVFMLQNTSVFHDEIIAQRLGLLPIAFDATLLKYPTDIKIASTHSQGDFQLNSTWLADCGLSPDECLLFELNLLPRLSRTGSQQYTVCADSLKWIPLPNQIFSSPPIFAFPRIPILGMHIDHEVHLLAVAVKGVARDHCKFAAISPIWYAPEQVVTIKGPVTEELAALLPSEMVDHTPDGYVIRTSETSMNVLKGGTERAILTNPDFKAAVQVQSSDEKFILALELLGQYNSMEFVLKQLFSTLQDKCRYYGTAIQNRSAVQFVDRELVTKLDPKGPTAAWTTSTELLNGRQCGLRVYLAPPSVTSLEKISNKKEGIQTAVFLEATVCTAVFYGEGAEWGHVLCHMLLQRIEVEFVSVVDGHDMDNKVTIILHAKLGFSALKLFTETLQSLADVLKVIEDKFLRAISSDA